MAKKPREPKAGENTAKKDEFAELRERFTKLADMWSEDRDRYKKDTHFLYVDHWPDKVRRLRENSINPRLCLEIDQLGQYQRQVINDSRQNRPQIKVRPVDSAADIETARIFDGLCRHWQEAGNADTCYDVALECSTGGGFGYFRILKDYLHDGTFEQDFKFSPVPNPLTVYYGEHKEPDGSDARECWIVEEIPKDEYEAEFPDFKTTSWEGEGSKYGDWCGEKIRVCERYEIRYEQRIMLLLEDGTVSSQEDYQIAIDNRLRPAAIKEQRDIPQKCLYWSKFNGVEYIEAPRKEPGDRIPVFPVWGNVQNVDGKVRHISMIHKSKDAQLLYDYAQTAFAERVGQTPEASWVAAEGQIDPYSKEWDGSEQVAARTYKPATLDGQLLPPPQRSSPVDIPAGFAQTMQQAEHGVQTSLGMYSASIGRRGNATSGVQEQEQARKGDVSSFHYHDNLARAIRSAGRYLVSAAPKVLDTKRVVRILGLDGKAENVQLDPSLESASVTQGAKSIFNIGVGTYDVAVDVGPSYQTSRQASAAGMLALAQADPTMWQTHGDLIAESQDWPDAQRFAQRSKLLLPPQIAQAEQSGESPEVQQVKVQAQQAMQERDQMLQMAQEEMQKMAEELNALKNKEMSKDGEIAVKRGELEIKNKEADIKGFEAETERIKVIEDSSLAKVETLLTAHEAKVKALVSEGQEYAGNVQPDDVEGQQELSNQVMAAVEQSHAETMQAVMLIMQSMQEQQAALNQPRMKKAQAVRQPDGSYTMTSIDSPMIESQMGNMPVDTLIQ